MSEKQYLLLLKKQLQNKRVICGYNQNDFEQTVITTGSAWCGHSCCLAWIPAHRPWCQKCGGR